MPEDRTVRTPHTCAIGTAVRQTPTHCLNPGVVSAAADDSRDSAHRA